MDNIKSLGQLGLSEKEAKIYLALLEIGESTVLPISKKAGLKRTHCYELLENLARQDLVDYYEKNNRRQYYAEDPQKLKEALQLKLEGVNKILPELRSVYNQLTVKPRIRFYEGEEGLKEAQYDTLKISPGNEILSYAAAGGLYYEKFADQYIKNRVKKNISVRAIVPITQETEKIVNQDKKQLRFSRLIPADKFPFTNEIDIYDNKVAIISYQKEFIAVIIESESIAKTQKMIFELAWEGAMHFSNKYSNL
ncbi:MAG: helix-turn-helix domain-containing protein [bacterium]|nr:helix-turn-helix domain-containing protein [bacterium]